LSQFSRRARWLNALFPASKSPTTRDPAQRSDDVSLVQQYDGGAWPIPNASSWFTLTDSPVGVTGVTTILTVPDDMVYRYFGMHAFTVIDPVARFQMRVTDPLVPLSSVSLNQQIITLAAGLGNTVPLIDRAIVIPPGLQFQVAHIQGGAATQLRYATYGCLAPVGTVFNC